jgi:para-aminobenzoate synthetase component 1
MLIRRITTGLDAAALFGLFQGRRHVFFLDSALTHPRLGRFSIIGFEPRFTLRSKNGAIEIAGPAGTQHSQGNPFSVLRELLAQTEARNTSDLPFIGGAVGYLAYDCGHYIEKLPRTTRDDRPVPDCVFGFYDGAIVIDHARQAVFLVAHTDDKAQQDWADGLEAVIAGEDVRQAAADGDTDGSEIRPDGEKPRLVSDFTPDAYRQAVQNVRAYIEAGEIYQANLTQRLTARTPETAPALYRRLRRLNPAPFAAYFDFGAGQILSSSPERLVQIRGRQVQTRPIKGTRPRGRSAAEDEQNRAELLGSEKDRAELLMIVDLERNDLGRVCVPGSVQVSELFVLEGYATVWHLVATVEGELEEGRDAIDCLQAIFPGGSITGAPKIRAMEIIDELEPVQRGVYTGAIGYFAYDGQADLNIAIRTLIKIEDQVMFSVGGGIVWDSEPQAEYDETLHKARALIETIGATEEEAGHDPDQRPGIS